MVTPLVIGAGLALLAGLGRSTTGTAQALPPSGRGTSGGASGPPGRPPGGPTVPAGLPSPSGGQGGAPGGASGPPRPRNLAPAYPFPGRATVEAMAPAELGQGEAPAARDEAVARWLRAGQLDPITWSRIPVRGGLEVLVSSDAVKFGGVRVCCSQRGAQWIADWHNALTPTAGIIDATWRAATLKVAPFVLSSPAMYGYDPGGEVRYWLEEQDGVEANIAAAVRERGRELDAGELVASVSKDYVLDHRLLAQPTQCAIYGWQELNGIAIQAPKSGAALIHDLSFFDYSHGVRLAHRLAFIHGEPVDLAEVYRHRSELVVFVVGYPAPPIRHPAVPPLLP